MNAASAAVARCALAAALSAGGGAAAASASEAATHVDRESHCQHDVLAYEDSVRLVRTALGQQAYEAMKRKQMSDDERDQLLFKGGYCAVVRELRRRKLIP
jgi:hypothetical protein